jgi:hypothetical protein
VCRDLQSELRSLNLATAGMSLSQAAQQRLIHQTLYDNIGIAYKAYRRAPAGSDAAEWKAYCAADGAWAAHVDDHRRQAAQKRAERRK